MLCVTLGRTRHKHMIAEHRYLVEQGAELVELRLDYIGRAVQLKRLLDERPGPVVITARRREDGGRWRRSETDRLALLRTAIAAGVEYVDIEADVAAQIPRYGMTKRIISYHNFDETPENLEEFHAAMADEDADIVKIATMATCFSDNLRMIDLVRNAKVPTIGICMGELGLITRIMSDRLGSPFTYATFSKDKKMAPGLLLWKDLQNLYRYNGIGDATAWFGVVGDPIAHSYSPLIHNTAFFDQDIDARYLPIRVTRSDMQTFVEHAKEMGISGLSVTIPNKEEALRLCTQAESSASGIGAINTMIFQGDEILGYNTDYRAAMDCIEEAMELDRSNPRSLANVPCMVLGAGGVSRAVAYGLKQRGANVHLSSRTLERAQVLAAELGCRVVEWTERHDTPVKLLVNGTPVGMHPDVDSSPYNEANINQYMTVFDTVYNPENTLLIKHARGRSAKIITGIDMFVRQAAYQFKLFTGKDAPVALMRQTIKDATNPWNLN
ncbi:MAG: shikimate dehydrogenase [Planctomycetota bacterium]